MRMLIICGWLTVAALAGAGLYGIAYEVDRMKIDLAKLDNGIARESEAIHMLSAEWTYLARPARIAELTERYLPELHLLTTEQIGHINDLSADSAPRILKALPRPRPATPASITVTQ